MLLYHLAQFSNLALNHRFPNGEDFSKLGAKISKRAKEGDFETYTRYSWVAD